MRFWPRSPTSMSTRLSGAFAIACAPSMAWKCGAQPEGFVGQLRQYQLEGLGWMQFLREFGFGGCLADDMGVGKTAQVLATLEARRAEGKGPSLVVVPKSVMFNWREESARFTPRLRVLEYHGTARDATRSPKHDLVLTTYGTMLRDAPALAKIDLRLRGAR
jgi:SNF2 family DNA or RNA helicase